MTASERFRSLPRRLAAVPALAWLLLAAAAFVPPASAHFDGAYSHEAEALTSSPDWMRQMAESTPLSRMSLPGTHDSMARFGIGGVPGSELAVQTQTLGLRAQLDSGIRMLDIRFKHAGDVFLIVHGSVYQNAEFGTDVLAPVIAFLRDHPSETVLMRVKEDDGPVNTGGVTRSQRFKQYQTDFGPGHFWDPAASANPTLKDLRGRIVVVDNFTPATNGAGTLTAYGLRYNGFDIQDEYEVPALYLKWIHVKNQLVLASGAGNADTTFLNHLSGLVVGPPLPYLPYFVASGHALPDTGGDRLGTALFEGGILCEWDPGEIYPDFPRIDFGICDQIYYEGMNTLANNHIRNVLGAPRRLGILMMDFPGPSLIEAIIQTNASAQDTFAPGSTANVKGITGSNGWYRGNVTVDWNWADNLTGTGIDPGHCTASSATSTEGAGITLSATCRDWAGNERGNSRTVKIDKTAPAVPSGFSATAAGTSQVSLAWSPSSDGLSGLAGYRVTRGGAVIANLGAGVLSHVETGLAPATAYLYTLVACDNAGNCSAEASVTATTAGTPGAGACGPAHGTTSALAPSTGLCSSGTASAVFGEVLDASAYWSWTCAGSGGGTTATCSANLPATFGLSVINTGTGAGAVTGSGIDCGVGAGCSSGYAEGTAVGLTATAAAGSAFAGWSGDCASFGTQPLCTLAMGASKSVTATFTVTAPPVPGEPLGARILPATGDCARDFYIAEATLAPGAHQGYWGMEVRLSKNPQELRGGFNLGGGFDGNGLNPGFGAFALASTQWVEVVINAQPLAGPIALKVELLKDNKDRVGGTQGTPASDAPLTFSAQLGPGFYVVQINSAPGSGRGTFQLALATTGAFADGVVVGGYLVRDGGGNSLTGFGAFCVPQTQPVSVRLYGESLYGANAVGDLVLTLRDHQRNVLGVFADP